MRDTGGVTGGDCRTAFSAAASALCELVERIGPDQWSAPALGEWDVRGLVGHASRALSTVEAYRTAAANRPVAAGPVLGDPVEYFLAVLADPSDAAARRRQDAAIAERGRTAGEELGPDPARTLRELAARAVALVGSTADDALFATPAGPMPLTGYLPTRTFELTVHCLDLARALGAEPPPTLAAGVAASCELAGRMAARRPQAAEVLMALTGRPGSASGIGIL